MKQLMRINQAPRGHWVGDGFPVRSLLSISDDAADTNPFLLLDHAGPQEFTPSASRRGVGEHPHRGFETVTIVYRGEVEHRDNAGNHGLIGPGDVQWMTAARGVLHEEFHSEAFTRAGGVLEMVQLWVNLPARDKLTAPRYQTLLDGDIPRVALAEGAGQLRVIAGSYGATRGPALTHTPLNVWDLRLLAGRRVEFAVPEAWITVLVVLHGEIAAGDQSMGTGAVGHYSRTGDSVAFSPGQDTIALLLSAEPITEPVAHYGPFVMNSQHELRAAITDFNLGRFGRFNR